MILKYIKFLFPCRHVWISDISLSLDGKLAVLACLWMPSATCSKCGKKYKGRNMQYIKKKWVDENNPHGRCRIIPLRIEQ